jgi:hypothetical protein
MERHNVFLDEACAILTHVSQRINTKPAMWSQSSSGLSQCAVDVDARSNQIP